MLSPSAKYIPVTYNMFVLCTKIPPFIFRWCCEFVLMEYCIIWLF